MGLSVLRQFLPHGLSATAAVILKKLEAGHILVTASKKREYAPDFISFLVGGDMAIFSKKKDKEQERPCLS